MSLCLGCQQDFSPTEDVHNVASLLKLYLRELPEPLVPFVCYSHFHSAVKSKNTTVAFYASLLVMSPTELAGSMESVVEELQRSLLQLPKVNINVMKYLV